MKMKLDVDSTVERNPYGAKHTTVAVKGKIKISDAYEWKPLTGSMLKQEALKVAAGLPFSPRERKMHPYIDTESREWHDAYIESVELFDDDTVENAIAYVIIVEPNVD